MRTRVLVVDDEPDLLELVHYNLTKAGYEVACVMSGAEALIHVQTHTPALILHYAVRLEDQLVQLTPTEFHLLHFLARRPGWVCTR